MYCKLCGLIAQLRRSTVINYVGKLSWFAEREVKDLSRMSYRNFQYIVSKYPYRDRIQNISKNNESDNDNKNFDTMYNE